MPLIETKGAASAQGFGLTLGSSGPVTYIEDVFSTYLYTGNGSTQTITNGIDLSGKGGLVWIKSRSNAFNHYLTDTVRGAANQLSSDLTVASIAYGFVTGFNSNGFGVTASPGSGVNGNNQTHVSWTFRKQPKFFDVVTYTGNGSNRTIAHNLGSVPGCIIVKKTSATQDWLVYHRSLGADGIISLNSTAASSIDATTWNNTTPTSTVFSVGATSDVNNNGATYVAYLFAHDAGGFGLTGSDNVISCGSFTTDGSGYSGDINLGYEPQWILLKNVNASGAWLVVDNMRGWPNQGIAGADDANLRPNVSDTEAFNAIGYPFATGFNAAYRGSAGQKWIYIAIRRGPMKVPTSGTSVYSPQTYYGNATSRQITFGFPVDMVFGGVKDDGGNFKDYVFDRLRGANYFLKTNDGGTAAESNTPANIMTSFASNTQITVGTASDWNPNSFSVVLWGLQRAPGFFDGVCYTGNGGTQAVTHNLGVAPEIIIVKNRTSARNWFVYLAPLGVSYRAFLDSTVAATNTGPESAWGNNSTTVAPTSTQFTVGAYVGLNASGENLVAYLFATCAGVSKVGSYTGTGALQTINCGFTGGARFVLIKRTDSTGDWYVYDSARGISSSGNDPYLLLNSTAAEVTGTNYVDTTSVGFQVTAAAPAGLNANGGTYIFLAIA